MLLARTVARIGRNGFISHRFMCTSFDEAQKKLTTLKEDPGNEVKLKLYGLFKQATVGKVNVKQPGITNFVGRAKWNAWNSLGDMTQEEAKQAYAKIVDELAVSSESIPSSNSSFKYLDVKVEDGVQLIKFNRPEKKNALLLEMYNEIEKALSEGSEDPSVVLSATTGAGDYYCSGNDLSNFTDITPEQVPKFAEEGGEILRKFVGAFIDYPKPIIAAVNGPAVGVSVTVMGLYDLVICSDNATFHTPFSNLGQSPEGCSSYTFPNIMGSTKANAMLLFNHKMSAQEAFMAGLVHKIVPLNTFQNEVSNILKEYGKLPIKSLVYAKKLVRDLHKAKLHQVNKDECLRLVERWQSEDCFNAIAKFFSRK